MWGFVFWLDGELIFFHASHAGKAVMAVRLEEYLRRYLGGRVSMWHLCAGCCCIVTVINGPEYSVVACACDAW